MKHVRTLIIGTHTDKSGSVFWRLVALTPPIHTDITAWKFCHTIHLISRDGHPKFIRDSIENVGRIQNLGEHFVSRINISRSKVRIYHENKTCSNKKIKKTVDQY